MKFTVPGSLKVMIKSFPHFVILFFNLDQYKKFIIKLPKKKEKKIFCIRVCTVFVPRGGEWEIWERLE